MGSLDRKTYIGQCLGRGGSNDVRDLFKTLGNYRFVIDKHEGFSPDDRKFIRNMERRLYTSSENKLLGGSDGFFVSLGQAQYGLGLYRRLEKVLSSNGIRIPHWRNYGEPAETRTRNS